MPSGEHGLTIREQSAILSVIVDGISWQNAYIIASKKELNSVLNSSSLSQLSSAWHRSAKVMRYYEETLKRLDAKKRVELDGMLKKELRERGLNETSLQNKQKSSFIDYSLPTNQTHKLNELVNTADDSKEALDALKTIIQAQRADKEAAKEKKQVRAYLPMQCKACKLYQKARNKFTK